MKRKNVFSVLTLISFGIIAGSTVIGAMPEKHANPLKATALNNGKFYSDYASMDDCVAAGNDVNINIAEEGFVLMKNDGTLPFDGVKNISVFGHNSVNPAYSGGGSGSAKGNLTPTSILDSLQAAGYKTNSVLSTFYQSARSGDTRSIGGMGGGGSAKIGETPVSAYDDALKASFKAYSDAALIVITRSGSEGADTPRTNVIDQSTDTPVVDQHYLELSKNEKDLISMVETSGAFSKIVIVLNSPSVMELKTIQDDTKINGMIWTGIPGYTGFIALGEILNGTVNPSGKTVDTYPVDLTKDPTFYNFGDGSQGMADGKTANYAFLDKDGNATTFSNNKFLRYEEGPYVGYRYYETRGVDDGPAWYAANVVYPFGFGLSYTNFSVTFDSASLPAASKLDSHKDDKITIKAKVKNTGSVAGKEVVEAYAHAPYIDGKIEKPSEQLVAFAKTKELQPNEEQDVDLESTFRIWLLTITRMRMAMATKATSSMPAPIRSLSIPMLMLSRELSIIPSMRTSITRKIPEPEKMWLTASIPALMISSTPCLRLIPASA
jgi:beta-glucosidase